MLRRPHRRFAPGFAPANWKTPTTAYRRRLRPTCCQLSRWPMATRKTRWIGVNIGPTERTLWQSSPPTCSRSRLPSANDSPPCCRRMPTRRKARTERSMVKLPVDSGNHSVGLRPLGSNRHQHTGRKLATQHDQATLCRTDASCRRGIAANRLERPRTQRTDRRRQERFCGL